MSELGESAHYFAGGKRIRLDPDPNHVGVDLRHPAARRLPKPLRASIETDGMALRKGIFLVSADVLTDAQRAQLDEAGALLPVFVSEGATLVVLPEVRVEYLSLIHI